MSKRADNDQSQAPLLRVITADATPEEIAALVAVFSALGSADGEAPERPRPSWSHPARGVRQTTYGTAHRSEAGGWRASGLPR